MKMRTTTTEGNDGEDGLAYGLVILGWSLGLLRRVSLAAVLSVLGLVGFGHTALFAGTYTDSQGLVYTTNSGALTATVTTGANGNITIPATINDGTNTYAVTAINASAFSGRGVTSVIIPDSVTSLGANAFDSCTGLNTVVIGRGITSIPDRAFNQCFSITSLTLPDTLITIGEGAFYNLAYHRNNLIIPASVTTIASNAFGQCGSNAIIFQGNAPSAASDWYNRFGSGTGTGYYQTGTTGWSSTLGTLAMALLSAPTVTSVSPSSGSASGGTSITITGTGLGTATGVTIGGVAATSVVATSATTITATTPAGSIGAKSVLVTTAGGTNAANTLYTYLGTYTDTQGLVYETNSVALTASVKTGTSGNITIPSSINDGTNTYAVTAINASAFYNKGLSSVIIPDSVTSMGANAFNFNTGLSSVVIGRGITSIPERAFSDCYSITTLTLPDTLTTIGSYAFYNLDYMRNLVIPASVTTIADNAFMECGVNAIIFRGNAPSVGSSWYARKGSRPGTAVGYYQTGATGWSSTLGTLAMAPLATPTVTSVSPLFGSGSGGTSITITGTGLDTATSVTIGGVAATSVVATSATTITATTPAGSAGAKSVLVTTAGGTNTANTLYTYLGTYTDSQGLVYETNSGTLTASIATGAGGNITIPSTINVGTTTYSVTAINASAFYNKGLSTVIIPDSVTSMGANAFNFNTGLTSVVIGRGITSIPERAFSDCYSITTLSLPDTLTTIGSYAFYNLDYMRDLVIPASVTSIADNAFMECGVNAIFFRGNAPSVGSSWYARKGSRPGTAVGYYQTGTTGWSSTLGTLAMALLAPPTVTSPTSASVASTSATLGGNVTATGGASLTAVGVVYSVTSANNNPQLSGTGVTNVTGTAATGVFTVNATGLTAGTAYSYAAYATTSAGTTYSSSGTFTTVSAPVNTVPGALSVAEETALAFTGANLITVADPDGTVPTTQLSVAHGTLTVSLSGGATIGAGANGSATLTLVGTSAQVNAALATLSYLPGLNYSGSDTLTLVTTKNLSGFGVGAQYGPVAGFSYVANPILGDSRTPDKAFDGTTTDSHSNGFSASASNPFYFKITAPDLKVISSYYMSGRGGNDNKPSSWTFQGSNDDNTWTVLDTQSGINLTFGTITTGTMSSFVFSNSSPFRYYRFAITASTGGYIVIGEMALVGQTVLADSDTVALTVTDVNDAPTLAAIALTGTEDTTFTFTAADFTAAYTDPESPAPASITIATLPATGTLKLSGTNVTANQVIPAANLANLTYVPAANENGAKTFTVTASDGALSSAAATVTVTLAAVTDAPLNTVPGALSVAQETALAFTGANLITVADPEGTVTTTKLSVAHGTLTVSLSGGATIGAGVNGSATLTLVGTSAQVNAALATLSYQPGLNYSGSDTLTLVTTNNLTGPAFGVGAQYGPVAGFSYVANPILGDSRTPDKAFDGTTTDSHSDGFSASASNPFYFKITAPDFKVISSYYMSGRGGNDNKPSSWTFQGSNDDNTWTVLDTQSDINLTFGTITTGAMSSFVFSNSSPFKYYRFAITASTGGYIVIGEMALVGQTAFADSDTVALTVTAVNRAPVVANAIPDQAGIYGNAFSYAFPANTFTDSDAGDTLTTTVSTLPAGITFDATTRTFSGTPTAPSTTTVTVTATDNFGLSVSDAFVLTIEKAALSVTADAKTKVYGAANPALTATITGFVNGETLGTSGVTGAASVTTTATALTGVGSATLTAAVGTLVSANYAFTTFATGALTITKAPLVVTADAKTKLYGVANPALTATISGYVNSETSTVVSGTAAVTTTATANSNVGSYPITPALGSLSATNYSFSFANGTLTVGKATPTLTWATPSAITYGTTLSATQLNATSSLAAGTITYSPASGTTPSAGTQTLTATFTPTDTTNYNTATRTVSLVVGKATPTLTWATPSAITYGTTLSATQLNATSSLAAGTITYSPASGTTPSAGTQTLTATFTPTDTTNYNTATGTVSLTVNKATPTLTWATPSAITYGTALSATQLNATASAAGTITYSPASGTTPSAGTQTLTATFTPTDTVNYNTATGTVSLTVNKATSTITWATPSTITYGTALSATQLNATASVAGNFAYSPASGTTPSAGTQTLTATFTPTDTTNYNTATGTVSLTVNKATPTLTWAPPSAITYGTTLSATQLNATSSLAAGTTTYSPASGTTPSAGTQTLTATFTPTDTANYNTATGTVSLVVGKATPTITWTTPTAITYGTTLSATQLNATSSLAAGTIIYSPASGTTPSAGTQTLTATFTPTDTANYNTATGTVSLTVNKATPTLTWATPATITYGTTLSATQLNATSSPAAGTIIYSPASGTTPSAGTQTLTATFTPTDTTNFNTATRTVSLNVNKATPTITWATPSAITYGTALSATQLNATANVAGAITYSPASGAILSVGTQALNATFTPTDTTNYNPASASVALSVAVAVPGSPTALAATTANGEATITFTAPGNPGSSAITGYTIRATATDGSTVTVNATGSPARVTGLTPGKSYRFTVTANNSAGSSESNTTSDALTISLVNQTITFAPLADRTSNSGSFALTASASSGLPVTFTVVSGPALLSGNVVDLTGAIGTVLIRASQAGNATYAAAPNGEVSFVVTAGATQAIFSKVESASSKTSEADLAVVLTVNSRDGTLLMVSSSTPSLNGAADFTVGSGGAFSASIVSTTGTNNVDPLGRRVLSAPVTYKITGTLVDNVLTGTISPLGYSFKSNVTPPSAGSASPVGFYKSTALAEGAGVTYSLVGPNNEVLVLAISPTATVGGLTTLKSDGTYSIAATTSAGNVTLSGGVNPTTTATTATLTLPGNIKVDFSGLSTTTKRTDRLIGLASRAKVGTGESVLITGLAIGGTDSKRVLIRAGGPALAAFGLGSTLPNPTLKIYRGATLIAQNDDWNPADAAEMERLGIFAFPNGSKDASILTTLAPGSYTAHVSDLSGTGTGVALAEIYDASVNPTADYQRLVSIASRGTVSVGDGALIGGFVVVGNSPKTLLIRGIGPTLTSFGLVGALADPVLTIYQDGEAIANNAGWANSATIATAATQAGAFALTTGSRDAALLVTLKPGSYTAQVKAAQVTSSGVALIEIYEVP